MPVMARHTYFCPLRWADMDVYRVINNVAFARYLEEARIDFILQMAPGEQDSFLRKGSVVVRHEIDYKQAARLGDAILARTWVGAATRIRFERHTELLRASDRVLLTKAKTVWCPIDAVTGKLASVGAEVRAQFSADAGDRISS